MSNYRNILGVLDLSGDVEEHCERILGLAQRYGARLTFAIAPLDLPRAIGREGEDLRRLARQEAQRRSRWLDDWLARHPGDPAPQRIALEGIPFLAIIHQVQSAGHDLVIKAAEDPDWSDRLFGSDDMHLLRKCPCPVWLNRPGRPQLRRILLALKLREDGSETARARTTREGLNRDLFEQARSLADSSASELHVVHAWEAPGESLMSGGFAAVPQSKIRAYVELVAQEHARLFDDFLRGMPAGSGDKAAVRHLIKGGAPSVIPELVRQLRIDLVIMGTIGRSGVPGLLIGNTAEAILDQLRCSVLAIKPPGFVSPVR